MEYEKNDLPLFVSDGSFDGAVSGEPLVLGTFVHDIFKNPLFTRSLINYLRERKRLPPLTSPLINADHDFEKQCNYLASILEESCFIPNILKLEKLLQCDKLRYLV